MILLISEQSDLVNAERGGEGFAVLVSRERVPAFPSGHLGVGGWPGELPG